MSHERPASDPGAVSKPKATLATVWYEVGCWDYTACVGKRSAERARSASVLLAISGALLATLAPRVSGVYFGLGGETLFALLSAVCLASSGFLGRELLQPERELAWVRARAAAESLQREVWRCLMAVPPYRGRDAGRVLQERANELIADQGVEKLLPPGGAAGEVPSPESFEDYLALRLHPQVRWYRAKASALQGQLRTARRLSFCVGLAAVIAGVMGVVPSWGSAGWVPVLATATAALAAHIQANRYGALVPVYQRTASQLDFLAAEWEDGWEPRSSCAGLDRAGRGRLAEIEFVEACEGVMSQENASWRDEWLDGTAQRRTEEARREMAAAAGSSETELGQEFEEAPRPRRGPPRGERPPHRWERDSGGATEGEFEDEREEA